MLIVAQRVRGDALSWWRGRSTREQWLLAALGVVLLAALYVTAVYAPLQGVRRQAVRDIGAYQALNAQLRVAGPTLAGRAGVARGASATVITGSAAELGLNIRRLDPEGRRIRVALEDAPFDALLRWLDRLERDRGLRLATLRVERRPTPGLVNAQAVLEEP